MTINARAIEALLRELLPAGGELYELRLRADAPGEPATREDDEGNVCAGIEVHVFEPGDGDRALRDLKSQEVCVVPAAHRADADRAAAYVRGWARSLPSIVAARGGDVGLLLPFELLVPQALGDDALRTEADFAAALGDRSRVLAWIEQDARAEVREQLARWGLADKLDEFLALRRPAIQFEDPGFVDEGDEEPTPVGVTRFGGEPDLPPGIDWPTSGGRPMTFAAQLDLAALSRFPAARELPREGLLSFFYDATPDCDFETKIEYPSRVLHIPSRAGLTRRPTPPGGDRRPEIVYDGAEPRALSDTLPPFESPFYEALLPVETVAEFRRSLAAAEKGAGAVRDPLAGLADYLALRNDHDADDTHRVLGYCKPYQNDPYVNAEVHASGRTWKGWEAGSSGTIAVSRVARRWRLLLQISAVVDGELLLEQDCGYLYFLIPEDALAARDWSRVWCELQCS